MYKQSSFRKRKVHSIKREFLIVINQEMRKLTKIVLPEVGVGDLKIRPRGDNRCESANGHRSFYPIGKERFVVGDPFSTATRAQHEYTPAIFRFQMHGRPAPVLSLMKRDARLELACQVIPKVIHIARDCSLVDKKCHFYIQFAAELQIIGLWLKHQSPGLVLVHPQSLLSKLERVCSVSLKPAKHLPSS